MLNLWESDSPSRLAPTPTPGCQPIPWHNLWLSSESHHHVITVSSASSPRQRLRSNCAPMPLHFQSVPGWSQVGPRSVPVDPVQNITRHHCCIALTSPARELSLWGLVHRARSARSRHPANTWMNGVDLKLDWCSHQIGSGVPPIASGITGIHKFYIVLYSFI